MLAFAALLALASTAEDADPLKAGAKALGKGLHHKAFEHFRTAHRALGGQSAWEHAELQEGLCVCAAKLRKEKVAVSACHNASSLRSGDELPQRRVGASHSLLMAQGDARLMADPPDALGAWGIYRLAAKVAVRGESVRLERESRAAHKRA